MKLKLKYLLEKEPVYEKEGAVQENVGAMIVLIMGVSIAVLVLIFTSVMSAQVYTQVEPDINNINNTVIKDYVQGSIESGFKAYKTTGNYLPILVLAVIIFVILGLIMSLGRAGSASYGGAL